MTIRPVPNTSPRTDTFRLVPLGGDPNVRAVHRDEEHPFQTGTVVLMAFRVDAWHQDPDGSLLASVSRIDADGGTTGLAERLVTLCPNDAWTIDELADLARLGTEVPA